MELKPDIEQYAPAIGPGVALAFLNFHRAQIAEAETIEVPDFLPVAQFPEHLQDRFRLDLDNGMLNCSVTLDDILKFSNLTGDYNIVHTDKNPYTGRAIVQGNLIASLAERLVSAYFDKHHFEHVDAYFNEKHSWIPKPFRRMFSRFAVRNKHISHLAYTFRDGFHPGDDMELKVTKFAFTKRADKDCKFAITCHLSHVANRANTPEGERYKPGVIKIQYDLVLPKGPTLQEVTEEEPVCTDEIELIREDSETFRSMLGFPEDKKLVMLPVVYTNSRILLKRQNQLEAEGKKDFGTGIYKNYKVVLFEDARGVQLGDRLKAFYFCQEPKNDIQPVTLYVTDEDDRVLYKFNAPILLLPKPNPIELN